MKMIGQFKQGDTFGCLVVLNDASGDPLTNKAADLKSQVRDFRGTLIEELAIRETDVAGTYLLECSDTELWPVSTLYIDIQYTDEDVITSTETLSISVVKDVTKDEPIA